MVSVVWLILHLLGVCSFSWWPVLIESFLLTILFSFSSGRVGLVLANVVAGLIPFSAFQLFCGLNVSLWWIIASPFWNLAALVVPGGYTISAMLMKRFGWIATLPTWMLVVLIIVDVGSLAVIVAGLVESRQEKKKKTIRR